MCDNNCHKRNEDDGNIFTGLHTYNYARKKWTTNYKCYLHKGENNTLLHLKILI